MLPVGVADVLGSASPRATVRIGPEHEGINQRTKDDHKHNDGKDGVHRIAPSAPIRQQRVSMASRRPSYKDPKKSSAETSSLSGIDGQAPCYLAFPEVVGFRKCRRDGVNCGPVDADGIQCSATADCPTGSIRSVGTVDRHRASEVSTKQTKRDLPGHLKRYLTAWYGYLPESRDDPEMVAWALEDRRQRGLIYLRETMELVTHASLPTSDLIRRVPALPGDPTASLVVTEILNRIPRLTTTEQDEVLIGLSTLLDDSRWLPAQRVVIDRALQRLVWRFSSAQAFALAARCVVSARTIRRQASYRFYIRQGLDDSAP
jgi:hypothetical protein